MKQTHKRLLTMIFTAVLVVCVLGVSGLFKRGVEDGYGGGFPMFFASGSKKYTQGNAALKIKKKNNSLNKPIEVQFNYGQDYNKKAFEDEMTLKGNVISVFIIPSISSLEHYGSLNYENKILLHEVSFLKQDIIDDQYIYKSGFFWFSKIKYKAGFSIDIDFNTIPFDKGVLVIAFSETIQEEVEGDPITTHDFSYVYFAKSKDKIRFSKR